MRLLALVLGVVACATVEGGSPASVGVQPLSTDGTSASTDAPVAPGDDAPTGADPVVADDAPAAPADDAPFTPDPTVVPAPPAPVAFHGLACPADGAVAWDPTDLCMGEACDLVVLENLCSLVQGGTAFLCLAKDQGGAWTTCPEAWADLHGVDPSTLTWQAEDAILRAVARTLGLTQVGSTGLIPEAYLCGIAHEPAAAEVTEVGLYFDDGRAQHTACASDEVEGRWGGLATVGVARVPVVTGCITTVPAGLVLVVDDDGQEWLETQAYAAEQLASGWLKSVPGPTQLRY